MNKAGGIIALIAGLFGTGAALVTLSVGGIGSALEADEADLVVTLGWLGLLAAFLTIVLGAVAMATTSKVPGILIIVLAIVGAFAGGTLVAICMALALLGGIVTLFAKHPARTTA